MEEYGEVEEALRALRKGVPVLIHDDVSRENEVDYVIHASRVNAETVYEMRTLAGGLICYAMPEKVASQIGIPFASDLLLQHPSLSRLVKTPRYGDKPAFSVWVNHVDVATGIRDEDRAMTIRGLHEVTRLAWEGSVDRAREKFYEEFMAPGHVPILIGRSIRVRRGHTELSLYLALLAGEVPSVALVEMLKKGTALSLDEARRVSRQYGYPLVTSTQILGYLYSRGRHVCSRLPC